MTQEITASQQTKISPEFITRLAFLAPKQKIRAIVMLQTDYGGAAISRRRTPHEREAALRATRQQAEAALPDIDRMLD
jgi:hypothetical protein